MKEMFAVILDKDEQIIKVYKPNKKRSITINMIMLGLFNIIMGGGLLVLSLLGFLGKITVIEDGVDDTRAFAITMLVLALIFFLGFFVALLVQVVTYHKTYYAFSNKRILIRTGFIGVDFTVLEMKLIGTTSIKVGLLDKFVRPNTGTIRFGSNATPVTGQNNMAGGLTFKNIDNAYDTYREIKEVVDTHIR